MINIEPEIFNIIAQAVRMAYPGACVVGEYVKSPSRFPTHGDARAVVRGKGGGRLLAFVSDDTVAVADRAVFGIHHVTDRIADCITYVADRIMNGSSGNRQAEGQTQTREKGKTEGAEKSFATSFS